MQPRPEQIQAAVDLVVERLHPDQIILFGSAARGQMREGSDLDLLVIRPASDLADDRRHDRWECYGDDSALNIAIDVISTDARTAHQRRRSAGYVEGAALEEGRTVYTRPGVEPLPIGPQYTSESLLMVRSRLCKPDRAAISTSPTGRPCCWSPHGTPWPPPLSSGRTPTTRSGARFFSRRSNRV